MSVIGSGVGAGVGATVGTAIGGPVGTIVGGAVGAGAEALVDGVVDFFDGLFGGGGNKDAEIHAASEKHRKWLEEVIHGAETFSNFRWWVLWTHVLGRDKARAWPRGMASDGTRHSFLYAKREEWRQAADRLIAERGAELQRQFEAERVQVMGPPVPAAGSGGGSAAVPLALLGALLLSRM